MCYHIAKEMVAINFYLTTFCKNQKQQKSRQAIALRQQ